MAWTYVGAGDDAPQATPVPPVGRAPPGNNGIAPAGATLSVEPPYQDRGIGISAAGSRPKEPGDFPGLAPELGPIVQRESGGKPFVGYTPPGQPLVDLSKAPLDENGFPQWEGNIDPTTGKRSHAAGIAQIQPETWAPIAKELGIHDFSLESQIRVANELHRREGDRPWAASEGGGTTWRVTQSGKWNVSPNAVASAQGRSDTSVLWMSPDDYLAMVPESADKDKRQSLLKSLMAGDQVEAIPSLDVKSDGGRLKITDQDGRNRAKVAKDEGVELIPVAVHGAGKDHPGWIEDMHGTVRRFNFTPVPKAEPQPSTMTGMPGLQPSPAAEHIMGAAAQGASEAFQGFDPGLKPDVRQALAGMSPGFGKEAATLGMSAVRGAELPFDVIGRAVNAALMAGARGGGQAIGEMTGAAQEPGFDPGIGAIREVIQPGGAFLAGAGAMPGAGMPRGVAESPPIAPAAGGASMTPWRANLEAGGRTLGEAPAPPPVANVMASLAPQAGGSAILQERALLAREAMRDFNIPITGPQVGMNMATKIADSTIKRLPLSGAGAEDLAVKEAFNRAVSKTIGEDSPVVTQSVMDRAKKRIGATLNKIENSNEVHLDDAWINDVAQIERDAYPSIDPQERSIIKRQIDNVLENITSEDKIPGKTYGNLMHKGAALDRAASSANPNVAKIAGEVQEALRDALQRSLSGDDLDIYREARFQYKNMKTIEPLVNKDPAGGISPALLNARVSAQFENRAYDATGNNPLDRLAKIGAAFLKEVPSSMTSERYATMNVLAKAGELTAAGLAGHFMGLPTALIGGGVTLGAGRLVGNYLRSPGLAERTIAKALGEMEQRKIRNAMQRMPTNAMRGLGTYGAGFAAPGGLPR